jgi:hypothetical protein
MNAELRRAPDRTRSAIVTIIFSVFALALGDAIIKGVSASFTLCRRRTYSRRDTQIS